MTEINHSEREHSLYSPSAFKRWSNCPGSVRLTKDIPDEPGPAALRGTWMHEMVDTLLENRVPETEGVEWSTPENWKIIKDVVMEVKRIIDNIAAFGDCLFWNETRVHLNNDFSDVFGTADLVIHDDFGKHLYVYDYKFGNELISPIDNGQLLMYATMVMAQMPIDKVVHYVTMGIIQPSAPNLTVEYTVTIEELKEWVTGVLEPAILAAKAPDAPCIPGDDQCQYCPASGDCEAQKAMVLSAFDDQQGALTTVDVTGADLAEMLPKLGVMEDFIKAVRSRALKIMMNGGSIPGYKVVRGGSKRKWVDDTKVDTWLGRRGIKAAQRREQKLIGIPAAEKLLADQLKDNPKLQANFAKLIHKPEGKLTLAPVSDGREAVAFGNPLLEAPSETKPEVDDDLLI